MKKSVLVFFVSLCMLFSCIAVHAEETDGEEWFEMIEGEEDAVAQEIVNPYNLYLNNVITFISNPQDNDLRLRAEVYCSETMAEITTIFYLQKKYSSGWKNVSKGTATKTNSHYMYKNMYVYDVTPGEYRCATNTMVTDYTGYPETLDAYSASIDVN